MINRCKYCGDIAPDFSDMCDTCAYIEFGDDDNYIYEPGEDDD